MSLFTKRFMWHHTFFFCYRVTHCHSYLWCRTSLIPFLVFPNLWPGRGLQKRNTLRGHSGIKIFQEICKSTKNTGALIFQICSIIHALHRVKPSNFSPFSHAYCMIQLYFMGKLFSLHFEFIPWALSVHEILIPISPAQFTDNGLGRLAQVRWILQHPVQNLGVNLLRLWAWKGRAEREIKREGWCSPWKWFRQLVLDNLNLWLQTLNCADVSHTSLLPSAGEHGLIHSLATLLWLPRDI